MKKEEVVTLREEFYLPMMVRTQEIERQTVNLKLSKLLLLYNTESSEYHLRIFRWSVTSLIADLPSACQQR
jgi:hypothetical protein